MRHTPFKFKIIMEFWLVLFYFLSIIGQAGTIHAASFVFANEGNGVNVVTHPMGYTGTGGTLIISVGIDPTSDYATDMEFSVKNIVSVYNNLKVTTGNIASGAGNNFYDFESVALHELGHALGISHPNASTESGLTGNDRNYTKSTDGADNSFNINSGTDNIIGSADDVRGDDINLNWFKKADNDPFTISATVDSTTYSNDAGDLPPGDLFTANGDRLVGADLGYSSTESVMQQGSYDDETQRTLAAEDVAALRYGMSGLDELAGTSDDYTILLTYAGKDAGADIVIDFDDGETSFASTQNSGAWIGATTHLRITTSSIYFNTGYNWYFNDTYSFNMVTTDSVTDENANSATGNGNITEVGSPTPSAHGVCWSTSQYPTIDDNATDEGAKSTTGTFTSNITGLNASTTYYVRAYTTNDNGTNYGNQVSFTTDAAAITPTVTTASVSSVTTVSASCGGNVTSDGGSAVTARGVCWAETQNPTTADNSTSDGSGTGSFTSSITGLDPGTKYYVRAYATNANGTAYGNEVSFTTDAVIPTLTTTAISSTTSSSASSGGDVSSDGGSAVTARGVCWAQTQNPTTADNSTSDGSGTGSFTSSITGLDPGTKYYVRAYATNSSGSAYGSEKNFTTLEASEFPWVIFYPAITRQQP